MSALGAIVIGAILAFVFFRLSIEGGNAKAKSEGYFAPEVGRQSNTAAIVLTLIAIGLVVACGGTPTLQMILDGMR